MPKSWNIDHGGSVNWWGQKGVGSRLALKYKKEKKLTQWTTLVAINKRN